MGYSGHQVTRPRSPLVILGGALAWAGLVGGVLVTSPNYHFVSTMKPEPVEMTWHELVEQGLTDNSHIRLVDVALDQDEPSGFFEDMLAVDPEMPLDDQQELFEELVQEIQIEDVFDAVLQPLKVYPQGEDPNAYPATIVVPVATMATESAIEEIESSGTLTGRFELTNGGDLATDLAKVAFSAAARAEQAQQETPGSEQPPSTDPFAVNTLEAGSTSAIEDAPHYVFQPVGMYPSHEEAAQWFWLSGMAVALGLVICGSGGPSFACCFFFTIPSILSLPGYPLRYGRASRTTRIVYLVTGLGLIGYGYETMVVNGRFGQLDGDLLSISLGFVPTFVGFAAVLGVGASGLLERLNISLDPSPKKSQCDHPPVSLSAACSLEPVEEDSLTTYEDPFLLSTDAPLPEDLDRLAGALATVGFEQAQPVALQDGPETVPILIQLGCQDMVVADIQRVDGRLRSRLVSVLQDGMTVITLSSNTPSSQPMRFGSSGQYSISNSDEPIEMLSAHLEHAIEMAEKRDTAVITFCPAETLDVATFARRVLADIRCQYGEEQMKVEPARYGRFQFPAQPIPDESVPPPVATI